MCDLWARIKIRKRTVDDLVHEFTNKRGFYSDAGECRAALREYWSDLGIKDIERLCREDRDLCQKITLVEQTILQEAAGNEG